MAPLDSLTLKTYIRFLDLENIYVFKVKESNGVIYIYVFKVKESNGAIYLDAKIVILSALVRKLWSKTSFCLMVANVTRSRTSHVQTAQDVF